MAEDDRQFLTGSADLDKSAYLIQIELQHLGLPGMFALSSGLHEISPIILKFEGAFLRLIFETLAG